MQQVLYLLQLYWRLTVFFLSISWRGAVHLLLP